MENPLRDSQHWRKQQDESSSARKISPTNPLMLTSSFTGDWDRGFVITTSVTTLRLDR